MLRSVLSRAFHRTRRARSWALALVAIALTVCGDPPVGPGGGAERAVRLAFQPTFQQMDRALFQVASGGIDNVHLVLRDATGAVVLDTIVAFPPGQDSVAIAATVFVRGESERFAVKFELRAGTQTLFEGTQDLVAKPGVNTPAPTRVPLVFVGPGARATRVTVTPASSTLQAGGTVRLTADVTDASGAPITDALLAWSSSNESVATVSGSGVVTARSTRGSAVISATTLSGISGSATVNVMLPPARVVVMSGDGQSGTVGSSLPQPLVVQVLASDGVGVSGVSVSFAAAASGATVSPAAATTDAQGSASTTMKLGTLAGSQTFTATVTGLSAASVTATATRGDASVITVVSGDAQVDTAGRALRQPLVVRVTDANGNVASGVGVTWSRVSGNGALSAATSTTDAQGHAQVTYTLGNTPGTDVVRAAISTQPASAVEFTLTTRPRAASRMIAVSGADQSGVVGAAVAQPLVVRVTDETGQGVPGVNIIWNATNAAELSARSTTTDAAGQSSVNVTYPTQPGTFSVSAQLATLSSASVGFTLIATAGPPAIIGITAGAGQSAAGGTMVPVSPVVVVTDRFGNALSGVSVSFTAGNGGSVSGSPATTNASGVATLGSWTLGPAAGPQTLTVTAGAATATILATATVVATPKLSMLQQPSASVANTQPFAVPPKVQLKTGAGAVLKTAGVTVTVALKTTGPTLRGPLTATTDTAGVATFDGLSLRGLRGSHVLLFTAPGYTSDTSKTFALTAGPAIGVFASSATTLSGAVGGVVAPTPRVLVTDSTDNPVAGVAVTFAVADTTHGVVTGGVTATDTTGHASPGSWTLGHGAGSDTLVATAPGLVGSPVRFVAAVTVGAATQLVKISGDAQVGVTGNPLALPLMVEARDAFSNPVAGVVIGFAAIAGGGSPATESVTTDANGRASISLTLGPPGADTVKACLPSCATAQVVFSALSIPVGADAIWNGTTSASWATAANWSPAVVPGSGNKVFIPAGQPFNPALGGNVSVADLTLAAGATLDVGVSQLALSGALRATGATMSASTGHVYFCGGTHPFAGASVTMVVDCGATVTPEGAGTIAGGLVVQGGSVFDVGTATVTVTGNAGMYSGARIKMIAAGGRLTVNGDYDSNPGGDIGDTWMTDGVLELKGNLTATSACCSQSFRAVGAHVTRFSGSAAQTVNFYYTDHWGRSTFGNVEFTGNNTVTLANNMRVHGTVTVTGTSKVTGGTIYHGGQLSAGASTDLSGLGYTQLNGGGAVFPLIGGIGPGEVQIAGTMTVTLPQTAVNLPSNLTTHSGAVLDLEGNGLTVTGSYGMYSGSRVKMVNAAAVFAVGGNADFNPGGDIGDTWFTAGTLDLKGNFSATSACCGQSFRAVGTHLTRFSGSGAQGIAVYYPTSGQTAFMNVEITNASVAGVATSGGVYVLGSFTNLGRFTINSGHFLTVGGAVSLGASSNTTNAGSFNKSTCSVASGGVFSGFSCP